jgi:hypothetical protein
MKGVQEHEFSRLVTRLWTEPLLKAVNKSLETVEEFRYLGTALTDQNCIHKEVESNLFRIFCLSGLYLNSVD